MYPVIHILGLSVKSYTLFAVLAALTGVAAAYRALIKASFPRLRSALLLLAASAAFLIGARLWNVIINPGAYGQERPWYVLRMTGFSLYGGLAGAVLAIWLYTHAGGRAGKHAGKYAGRPAGKMDFARLLDACAVPFAAAFCLSRIGCFLNGCCGGIPTDLPWGIAFPTQTDLIHSSLITLRNPRVHPTQLYELLAALAGAPLCVWLTRHFHARAGGLTALYGAWFCLMRLAILPLRSLPYPDLVVKAVYPAVYAGLAAIGIVLFILKARAKAMT